MYTAEPSDEDVAAAIVKLQEKKAALEALGQGDRPAPIAAAREICRKCAGCSIDLADYLPDDGEGFFSASEQAQTRVGELRKRWDALIRWGVLFKAPKAYRERMDGVEKFIEKAKAGSIDVDAISAIGADVRAMELVAADADTNFQDPGRFRTPFDKEKATGALEAAADAGAFVKDARVAAREAVKEVADAAKEGVAHATGIVPWWLLAGGGIIAAGWLLQQRNASRALGLAEKNYRPTSGQSGGAGK